MTQRLPVIALVGLPNVGKSTLFNFLTKTRDALVYDEPGVTRDRQLALMEHHEYKAWLIDTAGVVDKHESLATQSMAQTQLAIEESDIVWLMMDAKNNLTSLESSIIDQLRRSQKPTVLVINKVDGQNEEAVVLDYYDIAMGEPQPISATHKRGVLSLLKHTFERLDSINLSVVDLMQDFELKGPKVAVIGRPNVGKSTLINRLLEKDRLMVSDLAGTTRDSIFLPIMYKEQDYTFIDTAGVRKRAKVRDTLEKFTIMKTLEAIEVADVVVVLVDATEGINDQDLHLIGRTLRIGRPLVLALNKYDILSSEARIQLEADKDRKLGFVSHFVPMQALSGKKGEGLAKLFHAIDEAYIASTTVLTTSMVNRVLAQAVEDHPPPMINGRRIKLRYAHVGGKRPPIVMIHGNQTKKVPISYVKYLEKYFRNSFKLVSMPIKIGFKSSENPFDKGRK